MEQTRPPARRSSGLYRRYALGALIIFTLSAATTATALLLEVKTYSDIISTSAPIPGIHEKGVLDDVDPGGPQTILLLGSDRRYEDLVQKRKVRSDTMMLVRLDPSKGATAVMSIPRDLKVDIPGYGENKINNAYFFGGPKLTVKTVRALLNIAINHVVNVNFGGFRRAVDRLGCVYVDVDRRYFHSNAGLPPSMQYAEIDIPAGYQKLCGQDALDYVRFRHADNDLVRGARQQDFLGQAKSQIGVSRLFSDRKGLLRIFATYTQTDIRGTDAILRLLKLVFESAGHPVQKVAFPGIDGPVFVEVDPFDLDLAVERFLNARASPGSHGSTASNAKRTARQRRLADRQDRVVPLGLFPAEPAGQLQAEPLAARVAFPVYYPQYAAIGGQYLPSDARAYDIYDKGHHRYRAYRIVASAGQVGQYYGIQGTTWKAPPILDNPSERRRMRGRTYELFFDGSRLRLVAWRTPRAAYWVANSLLNTLTNKQMLGLARSLTRFSR
jgi:LCP family protein required for cell wall assembly